MTKPKLRLKLQWVFTGLIALAAATFFYIGFRQHRQYKKDHIFIEIKPIHTAKGWGYNIYTDGKIYIHQDIVPALPTNRGFRTEEDAMAVGKKVYDRLVAGQMPMVTAKEVQDMGIIPDSTTQH
ncbi:MAG: DUF4907 domain-containing protein [Sphingobacteriales bacterium]|nr:DUF4907 domain-containing protein [Sphingobacteriales bacterium]